VPEVVLSSSPVFIPQRSLRHHVQQQKEGLFIGSVGDDSHPCARDDQTRSDQAGYMVDITSPVVFIYVIETPCFGVQLVSSID
jgi:hypothetical protein